MKNPRTHLGPGMWFRKIIYYGLCLSLALVMLSGALFCGATILSPELTASSHGAEGMEGVGIIVIGWGGGISFLLGALLLGHSVIRRTRAAITTACAIISFLLGSWVTRIGFQATEWPVEASLPVWLGILLVFYGGLQSCFAPLAIEPETPSEPPNSAPASPQASHSRTATETNPPPSAEPNLKRG